MGEPRGGGRDGDAGAGAPLERAHPLGRQRQPVGRLGGGARGLPFLLLRDTAYSQDSQVGRRLGPFDLAAIAIGHYEPRWFMRNNHINPEEAVRIHGEIGARRSLGIHWGTFEHLTIEPLDQPLRDLAAARRARGVAEEEFFVLRHGQTRVIE